MTVNMLPHISEFMQLLMLLIKRWKWDKVVLVYDDDYGKNLHVLDDFWCLAANVILKRQG